MVPRPARRTGSRDADALVDATVWTVSEPQQPGRHAAARARRCEPAPASGELPSEGIVRGAVQVPPSGEPVVFLADHPVTGGYPVVAVVVDADVDRAAQAAPGPARALPVGGRRPSDRAPAALTPAEARARFRGGLVTPTAGLVRAAGPRPT